MFPDIINGNPVISGAGQLNPSQMIQILDLIMQKEGITNNPFHPRRLQALASHGNGFVHKDADGITQFFQSVNLLS